MHSQSIVLSLRSERSPQFVDITDEVCRAAEESAIRNGLVTVYTRDGQTAVKINEHEPLLLEDLERLLAEIGAGSVTGPRTGAVNGSAAVRQNRPQSLLGSSETIPLVDGRLQFGRWQRLFLIELDQPGPREVLVQIVGA